MKIKQIRQSNKNNKIQEKWRTIITFVGKIICEEKCSFSKDGYLYLIELIKHNQNKEVLKNEQYIQDTMILYETISKRIVNDLFAEMYIFKDITDISKLLLIPEYQEILFGYGYTDNYKKVLCNFFVEFWGCIINDKLFQNNKYSQRLISLVENCGLFSVSSVSNKKNKNCKENSICCPYFITIFVFQLIVFNENHFPNRLKIFSKIINSTSLEYQVLAFILQYIAFQIVKNLRQVVDKNGETLNLYESNNYVNFVKYIDGLSWDNFCFNANSIKCNKDLKNNIDEIMLFFSVSKDNECENADFCWVNEIVGENSEDFNESANEVVIDELWRRILVYE